MVHRAASASVLSASAARPATSFGSSYFSATSPAASPTKGSAWGCWASHLLSVMLLKLGNQWLPERRLHRAGLGKAGGSRHMKIWMVMRACLGSTLAAGLSWVLIFSKIGHDRASSRVNSLIKHPPRCIARPAWPLFTFCNCFITRWGLTYFLSLQIFSSLITDIKERSLWSQAFWRQQLFQHSSQHASSRGAVNVVDFYATLPTALRKAVPKHSQGKNREGQERVI